MDEGKAKLLYKAFLASIVNTSEVRLFPDLKCRP